ncbi:hypothetical protein ACJMK2_035607 [Sinanodonta woodiana]|uniref:DUF4371 domain-containing protein n=1 Tax=Sinanodonta woodiana TaxID=1069815 RepID=A0ABD3WWW0_SINWO
MEMMCALQEKNSVELGINYKNRFRVKDFVLSISQVLREVIRERLNSSKFISILADGSTDATISEQEM